MQEGLGNRLGINKNKKLVNRIIKIEKIILVTLFHCHTVAMEKHGSSACSK